MSKGYSGLFSGTKGRPSPGSIDLMDKNDDFIKNIKRSSDIDTYGRLDIIAHGNPKSIQYQINGKSVTLSHRELSKLLKSNKAYIGKSIRLLSCNTGENPNGFAQNLANKLNVIVEAPTKIVWAYPNGECLVASRDKSHPKYPNLNDRGKFVKFYPGGNKNGKH